MFAFFIHGITIWKRQIQSLKRLETFYLKFSNFRAKTMRAQKSVTQVAPLIRDSQ